MMAVNEDFQNEPSVAVIGDQIAYLLDNSDLREPSEEFPSPNIKLLFAPDTTLLLPKIVFSSPELKVLILPNTELFELKIVFELPYIILFEEFFKLFVPPNT